MEIDSHNIGTCKLCGEVIQYPFSRGEEKIIIKEGAIMENVDQVIPRPKGRLTLKERKKLIELGPDEWCQRNGISGQGKGIFHRVYQRLVGGQPYKKKLEDVPYIAYPTTHLDTVSEAAIYDITYPVYHPALQALLDWLPEPGEPLSMERRIYLVKYFEVMLDLAYPVK